MFYQLKDPSNLEPSVITEELEKMIEDDNTIYMREVDNENRQINYNKAITQLASNQQTENRYFEPEHKHDFDNDGAPGVL